MEVGKPILALRTTIKLQNFGFGKKRRPSPIPLLTQ
jgi:hypothetical protein